MTDVIGIIEDGGEVKLHNGYDYERLDQYQGVEPGIILGVYRKDGEDGYHVIAHDHRGRVVFIDGLTRDRLTPMQIDAFALEPIKRKFVFEVKRTRVDYATIEVEATSQDEAEDELPEVAEGCHLDIDWDEDGGPEFEIKRFVREIPC